MNGLRKHYHDFPRLAKESGYMFQLYRGRINWNDLDGLDVQEIIDERNFELLEQNLIHVVNCNLDREYDLKILDKNFVKLFKVAQLGIDYLSYCELYLDKCVILLQEQLTSCQEECARLKEEIEMKDEELKKSKKKAKLKSQNYKCNKCSKIFANETYLESHEKRRHRSTCELNQGKSLSYTDQSQQTDIEKKSISVFTQTLDNAQPSYINELEINGIENVKRSEQEMKIDNLKRDLEDLKIRLSLAEKTMEEKKNYERPYSGGFPSAVIPIIHSYISPTYNGQVPLIPATPTVVTGIPNQLPVREEVVVTPEALKKDSKTENNECSMNKQDLFRQMSFGETPRHKSFSPERVPAEGASTLGSGSMNSNDIITNNYECLKGDRLETQPQCPFISLDNQVMDVRPKLDNKPTLLHGERKSNLPRTSKSQIVFENENLTNDFSEVPLRTSPVNFLGDLRLESESPSESLEPLTSTPVKISSGERSGENETKWDEKIAHMEKVEQGGKSRENSFDGEGKSKSFLQKIVKKKSPKIQELTTNLKNSFSQLYGSVSLAGKKNPNAKETTAAEKSKSDIIEGLHRRLRELGIDPEWTGIPTETMKQKLSILEHHRNILSKESRLYPYLRRKLQKHVLKKLKNNSMPSKGKIRLSTRQLELDLEETNESANTAKVLLNDTNEITIYDTDRDSDLEGITTKENKQNSSSTASDLPNKAQYMSLDPIEPIKLNVTSPNEMKWNEEERETTDFSIFQAGKFKSSKLQSLELKNRVEETEKPKIGNIVDRQETDSDFDDELFTELERKSTIHIPDKGPRKDTIASFPAKSEEIISEETARYSKTEAQSILKSDIDSKLQLMSKKKVLFAEEPEIFESTSKETKFSFETQKIFDLSSVVDDDDDWSIESEWVVNKAS